MKTNCLPASAFASDLLKVAVARFFPAIRRGLLLAREKISGAKSLLISTALLVFTGSIFAADPIDLGQGLMYLRVHALTDSNRAIESAVSSPAPLVLDLRYATTTGDSLGPLKSALTARKPGDLLLILVSPDTPTNLAELIAHQAAPAVTLGVPGSKPEPRVVVRSDAARDRRAFDALDTGTSLTALISGKIEKDRFDEATLVKEFKNGNPDAQPSPPPDPTTSAKAETQLEKPEPVIDRVLQRALQLHRALQALRR